MKKISFIVLICLSLLIGCGHDPNVVVEEAINNIDNLDDMTVDIDMNYKATSGQASIESSLSINQQIDYKNKAMRIKSTNATIFGVPFSIDAYYKEENNKTFSYTKEDNLWFVEVLDDAPIDDFFSGIEYTAEKVFTGVTEYETYRLIVPKDSMLKMLNSTDLDDFTIHDEEVEVTVTIKDNYVDTMAYSLNFSYIQDDVEIEMTADYSYTFSNFNTTGEITIPENVLNNTMDINDYNSYVYAYNYLVAIETYLYDFYDDMTFTDTSLDYGGPEPDIVKAYIEDGYIADGLVEVEGYRFRVQDGEIIEAIKLSSNV